MQRAIALAMLLADLAASGIPIDARSIAAAVVADGVASGHIAIELVRSQLGTQVRSRRHQSGQVPCAGAAAYRCLFTTSLAIGSYTAL